MTEWGPTERSLNLERLKDEALEQIQAVVNGKERLLLQRDGKVVAAIITAEDLRNLRRFEKRQRERLEPFLAIGRKFADVPTEELEREVAKAVAEVRAEMYGERTRAEPE